MGARFVLAIGFSRTEGTLLGRVAGKNDGASFTHRGAKSFVNGHDKGRLAELAVPILQANRLELTQLVRQSARDAITLFQRVDGLIIQLNDIDDIAFFIFFPSCFDAPGRNNEGQYQSVHG